MSRNKGKRGEREAAKILGELLGIKLRRSQQVKGTADSADVEPVDFDWKLHPEIKRTESTLSKATYNAMEQAKSDSENNVPFVMSRKNNEEWLIVIQAEKLVEFCEEVVRIKKTVQK